MRHALPGIDAHADLLHLSGWTRLNSPEIVDYNIVRYIETADFPPLAHQITATLPQK